MAKTSELQKVQLLENAVLINDVETVKALFDEHKEFEFTARALGYAARYAGVEMVDLLISKGVSFQYKDVPALARKYGYLVTYSKNTKTPMDFSLMLLPDYKDIRFAWKDSIEKECLNSSVRVEIIKSIANHYPDSLGSVLYYSIVMEDSETYDALREAGVEKLSRWFDDVVTGINGMNYSFSWTTDRELLLRKMFDSDIRTHKKILGQLHECVTNDKWRLFPSDFDGFADMRSKRIHRCCAIELFDFYYDKTNFTDRATKAEILRGLVENDNADGLDRVLEAFQLNLSQFNELFEIAQDEEKNQAKASLLNYQNVNSKLEKRKKEELSKTLRI